MDEALLKVADYEELVLLDGRISPAEVAHLSWLGAQVPAGGQVVELGSFRGKSICAIGMGARSTGREGISLTAVDLWEKGLGVTASKKYSLEKTWKIFQRQTRQMALHVETLKMSTVEAWQRMRTQTIDLLFIDAAHDFTSVNRDYQMWGPLVKSGGYIAFHDYAAKWPGVTKLIDGTVRPSGIWAEERVIDRIWSARRR